MRKNHPWFDETGGESDDFEQPDAFDDASDDTEPCPECGADIYEDAEQCPHCGAYVTHSTSAWSGRPLWWIVLGVLGVVALVIALVGLGF
jgi:hypothetical protein